MLTYGITGLQSCFTKYKRLSNFLSLFECEQLGKKRDRIGIVVIEMDINSNRTMVYNQKWILLDTEQRVSMNGYF